MTSSKHIGLRTSVLLIPVAMLVALLPHETARADCQITFTGQAMNGPRSGEVTRVIRKYPQWTMCECEDEAQRVLSVQSSAIVYATSRFSPRSRRWSPLEYRYYMSVNSATACVGEFALLGRFTSDQCRTFATD